VPWLIKPSVEIEKESQQDGAEIGRTFSHRTRLHPDRQPPDDSTILHLTASPVVELNRAIAVPRPRAPEAGLRIVDRLGLDDFRYLHSTKGELLRRLGRMDEARDAYRRARELTDDGAERRFIERRLTELATTGSG